MIARSTSIYKESKFYLFMRIKLESRTKPKWQETSGSFFPFDLVTIFTSYKYNHLHNLQYSTATHIIYSTTTVAYTTYNTIRYLYHYY